MNKFIKVHLTRSHIPAAFAYINTDNITSIVPEKDGSLVYFLAADKEVLQMSKRVHCLESPDAIMSLIDGK